MKILIVDDNEDVRFLTNKWLTEEGHKVITASDGNEAIKKLSNDIDIIFLDIMMPGPNPKTILENIKKKASKSIVIYLTAVDPFALTSDQQSKGWKPILEPPVMGYLKKPMIKKTLIEKIKDAKSMFKVVGLKKKK